MYTNGEIIDKMRANSTVARWPHFEFPEELVRDEVIPAWNLPTIAAAAAGSDAEALRPVCAALAASQMSIVLIDDILDEEPDSWYEKHGAGKSANVAAALGAIPFLLLTESIDDPAIKAVLSSAFAKLAFETAHGQDLDVSNLNGEENYWAVVEAKSTPYYRIGFEVGGIVAGASVEEVKVLAEVGRILGQLIQIEDDLGDALAAQMNSDWIQGRNNLLLLYARTAPHDDQQTFIDTVENGVTQHNLRSLQQILVRSGAVSYAAFHIVTRYRQLIDLFNSEHLTNPIAFRELILAYETSISDLISPHDPNWTVDKLRGGHQFPWE